MLVCVAVQIHLRVDVAPSAYNEGLSLIFAVGEFEQGEFQLEQAASSVARSVAFLRRQACWAVEYWVLSGGSCGSNAQMLIKDCESLHTWLLDNSYW